MRALVPQILANSQCVNGDDETGRENMASSVGPFFLCPRGYETQLRAILASSASARSPRASPSFVYSVNDILLICITSSSCCFTKIVCLETHQSRYERENSHLSSLSTKKSTIVAAV